MGLQAPTRKCLDEALKNQRSDGWIAGDAQGFYVIAHSTPAMSFALVTEQGEVLISSR